jgi:hypothetical protein
MKHENVTEAFNLLLTELKTVLGGLREQAAAASCSGRYDKAEANLTAAKRIERFVADIHAKLKEWKGIHHSIKGTSKVHRRSRMPRGERKPQEAFRLPILRALVALGGEGRRSVVLDSVYQEMKSRLKPADLKPLPSVPKTPRWRNTAQWARQSMVNEGLLRSDSPRGTWAITEEGRKYLLGHRG